VTDTHQQGKTDEASVFPDTVDALSGLVPDGATFLLRHHRAKIAHHTQLSEDALFDVSLPDISLAERLFAAWYAAALTEVPGVASHYRQQLLALGDIEASDAVDKLTPKLTSKLTPTLTSDMRLVEAEAALTAKRLSAIATHTRLLTLHLVRAEPTDLAALAQAGLTTFAIVVLSQLVAFMSYQTRLVAMLSAMRQSVEGLASSAANAAFGDAKRNEDAALIESKTYTFAVLGWQAWRDVVPLDAATPEQIEVLTESHPKAKTSDYYLLLIHAPEILRQRSAVFNAIMYQPGGLARAERELGATVVSRINGCVYCASVHAQRFEQLAKRRDSIEQVFVDPFTAGTSPREQALVRFSIDLTRAPGAMGPVDIHALRAAGLNDAEILDLAHSIAIFAWANRLMLTLGEPVFPAD